MASATTSTSSSTRKKFRVAVSGPTVDGREISAQHLKAAATHYNPALYGARVNVEHCLSIYPGSELSAMGDVIALSAEDISDGPLAGRTALYADIEPSERMKQLTAEGKKVYSSIELHPNFALNGQAYMVGLAMTDMPASLGTERLKFAAQQRQQVMTFNNQQGEAPLFTDAMEAGLIELTEQRSDEGRQWFSRVVELLGKGRQSDSEQFTQVRGVVEGVAQSHADLLDRFNTLAQQSTADHQTMETLKTELTTLRQQLQTQDNNATSRLAATGSANAQLADY